MICKSCLIELDDSMFYASNRTRCKECVKASVTAHRLANIDRIRAYDRMRGSQPNRMAKVNAYAKTPAGRIAIARAQRKWEVANAIRRQAQIDVGNAIRDGRLERQPCFICGWKAEAHHPDYSAPLAVAWLCDKHHKQAHKEHRAALRLET